MKKEVYWSHVANVVYVTVRDCLPCTQNRADGRRQRQLQLFFPENPLEYVDGYIGHPTKD